MAHREDIKAYLGNINLDGRTVVDWGMGTKPVWRYCKGKPAYYLGIDKLDHVGADLVVDISKLVMLQKLYEVAFCMEVIEHVEVPDQLLRNIYLNLEEDGQLFMSVPFQFPVHSPQDYWRFTDQGITLLLNRIGFIDIKVSPTDNNAGWLVSARK